jgi:thioredoxin-related protein
MITKIIFLLAILVTGGLSFAQAQSDGNGATTSTSAPPATQRPPVRPPIKGLPLVGYDEKADAAADIKQAVAEAEKTGKRVFIEVGGEWCIWCHHMEDFFKAHADLSKLRDDNFVTVKVDDTQPVLSSYPPVAGYPHIFILGPDGAMLHSEDTSLIEDGKSSYDLTKFTAFLNDWKTPQK